MKVSYHLAMRHELWVHADGQDFCLAGPRGDAQRALVSSDARLVWTVEAESHFAAMTLYYEHMGWGTYTTDFPDVDQQPYADRGWESE
jgi:hypothetical protein